jgi:hypothetical protein
MELTTRICRPLIALSSSQKLLRRNHKQLVLTLQLLMHVTVIQNPVWLLIVVQLAKIAVNQAWEKTWD